jgi:hypothetical protein
LTTLAANISTKDAASADVQVAGSGVTIGDQLNLTPIATGGLRYKFTGAVSVGTTGSTTKTISIAAGNLLAGTNTIGYNAASTNVTGTLNATVPYYLYVSNNAFNSGAHTLHATTDPTVPYGDDNIAYLGAVDVTFTSGTGGTGTSGGGGGLNCVTSDAWVETANGYRRAHTVEPGDLLRVLADDLTGLSWQTCTANSASFEFCYRICGSETGISLTVAESTPITLRDGSTIAVKLVDGHELPFTVDGRLWWEPCTVEISGMRMVQHISCDSKTYAAGNEQGYSILTHNASKP